MFTNGISTQNMSGKSYTKTIKDLSPVLYEHIDEPDRAVYEVRRGELDLKTKTCYDETTIFNGLLGVELPKTFGHYHPRNKEGYFFPELYTVLEGQAWFLLQKADKSNPKVIQEAILVKAAKGEKIIMPLGFGHLSVNPEKKDLKLANWKAEFDNDYQIYESLHGACYYLLELKDGSVDIIKNSFYEMVPELIKVKPKKLPEELKNLEFLTKPEKYLNLLTVENCFEKI